MTHTARNHYVNNALFLQALKDYQLEVKAAKKNNQPKPRVSNYIGECILLIATRLSYRPNFINYSYREEMISDGIENCLMYIDNFDPARSTNPFAYFTQVIYYAFIRRIQKEKKQTLIKGHLIMNTPFELFDLQDQDADGNFHNSFRELLQMNETYSKAVEQEEQRRQQSKAKRAQATLDDIIEK